MVNKTYIFLLYCKKWQKSFLSCALEVSFGKWRVVNPTPPPPPPFVSAPSTHLLPLPVPACRSSEGHELKLPFSLPVGHPHGIGGMLGHLHDADRQRLMSLVNRVSHYLAGGGRRQGELLTDRQSALLCCPEPRDGYHSSWGRGRC